MLFLGEILATSLHLKEKAFMVLAMKLQMDAVTSDNLLDFLSFDKVTTTGILISALVWMTMQNKKLEAKYSKLLSNQKSEFDTKEKDLQGKIDMLQREKEDLLKSKL